MEIAAPYLSVYRLKWPLKAVALFAVAVGSTFTYASWTKRFPGHGPFGPAQQALALLILLTGALLAVHAYRSHVRFTIDGIEYHSLLGIRTLPLAAIRGRRVQVYRREGRNIRYLKLEPTNANLRPIRLTELFDFDDAFYGWFYALPNLDEDEKA